MRLSQNNCEDQVAHMGFCSHTDFSVKVFALTLPNNSRPKAAAFCTGESPFQSLGSLTVNLHKGLSQGSDINHNQFCSIFTRPVCLCMYNNYF